MKKPLKHITVFEHQSLWVHKGGQQLTEAQLLSLQRFYGEKGVSFFKLIHKGVQFNKFAGVLQIDGLVIEVLPKADKNETNDKIKWQKLLIGMLRAVGSFDIQAPSSSSLSTKSNFILDLYFELFVKEVEYLFHKGLIKKYRKREGNSLALKGSIVFGKHIQQNLMHQERFYVKNTTYDNQHLLHQILYKTLSLLKNLNTNVALSSRIGNLLLNFPDMKNISVIEATFNKIVLDRKSAGYQSALDISKLLLLNYHPDLSKGHNNVLALMFDMNLLWERFIYVSLQKNRNKYGNDITITEQISKYFWESEKGSRSSIRPDIVINKDKCDAIVVDTKWKNIGTKNPSPEDLRQLYVYHDYYQAKKVALLYPGGGTNNGGKYFEPDNKTISDKECSVITIATNGCTTIKTWQEEIAEQVFGKWLKMERN